MFLNNQPTVLIFIILFQSSTANIFSKDDSEAKSGSKGLGLGGLGGLGLLDFSKFNSSCKGGELIAQHKVCIPKTSKGVIQDPPELAKGTVG